MVNSKVRKETRQSRTHGCGSSRTPGIGAKAAPAEKEEKLSRAVRLCPDQMAKKRTNGEGHTLLFANPPPQNFVPLFIQKCDILAQRAAVTGNAHQIHFAQISVVVRGCWSSVCCCNNSNSFRILIFCQFSCAVVSLRPIVPIDLRNL